MKPAHKSKTGRDAELPVQGRAVTSPTAGRVRMLAGQAGSPARLGGQQDEGEGKLDFVNPYCRPAAAQAP